MRWVVRGVIGMRAIAMLRSARASQPDAPVTTVPSNSIGPPAEDASRLRRITALVSRPMLDALTSLIVLLPNFRAKLPGQASLRALL